MEKPTNFKVPGKKKNLIKAFPLQRLKEESEIETFLVQHKYQYTMVVSRVRKYNSIYSSQVCAYLFEMEQRYGQKRTISVTLPLAK